MRDSHFATHLEAVPLRCATSAQWLPLAIRRFDEVLVDHAHCEKKAAVQALSLLQAYPEVPTLPGQMARLAREESSHLAQVLKLMEERGLTLGPDQGDPYAQGLMQRLRNGQPQRCLDRLLVAAIIEARSCERLGLLAEGLPDPKLRAFYRHFQQAESGHQALFLRLAGRAAGEAEALSRLSALVDAEAAILQQVGIRAAIH